MVECISLAAEVGRLRLEPAILNASGPLCTYDDELWPLARSAAGGVVLKSATFEPRAGNPEPRVSCDREAGTSLNAVGLANLGFEAHAEQLARLREAFPFKPLIASVAGLQPEHFAPMARRLGEVASALEINLSCPNVASKPQLAFDLEASRSVLGQVREATDCDLWVKLPPYQDRRLIEAMAGVLLESGVQAAVCINSPSGLEVDVDTETSCIHPNGGMGGAGGRDILRIALWNVRQLALALGGRVAVVGCGGIESGADVLRHVLAGASAVEVGTAYLVEGPGIFARLEAELRELLQKKGAAALLEKRGQLRVLDAAPQGSWPQNTVLWKQGGR
jgi:dihydroorotate dehydrogenase (fumarate)